MAYISGTVLDDTGAAVGGRTVRAYRRDTGVLLGETTTASGTVAGDSDFSSVTLLLHGDGTNGSTTIVDSGPSPKTVTAYGNAQISTAQSKFGGSSLYFDGTGDYLTLSDGSDWAFGTGDFTIEFWMYATAFATNHSYGSCLVDSRRANESYLGFALFANASGVLTAWDANSVAHQSSSGAVGTSTWAHIAISRASGTQKVFVAGTQVISYSSSYDHTGQRLTVATVVDAANTGANFKLTGYIDDLRITKGVARYTADFTVPDVAFPACSIDLTTGGFYIPTSYTGEVNVVTLDDSGGTTYNDKILRTTPV